MNARSRREFSAGATRFLGAAAFATCCAVLSSPAGAYDAKDCEQVEVATLSLRACSALLEAPSLSDQERARYLARRGAAWLTEEDPDQAVADFTRALTLDPANGETLRGRARAYGQLGQQDKAAQDFSAAIGSSPVTPETEQMYFDRAASFHAAGKSDAALADYDKILEASPNNVKARLGRARIFTALKDRDKALAEFDAILKADPKESAAFLARAEAAETWGDTASAIADYRMFIQLNNRKGWVAVRALRRLGAE